MTIEAQLKPYDILSGNQQNAQLFITDEVAVGLTIAPTLGFDTQESKRYNFYTRDLTSKQIADEGLLEQPMPSAEGSKLTVVSGTELTPDSTRLVTKGFRYIVPISDIEDSPKSFLLDIQDMCYVISKTIEASAYSALKSKATESTAEVIGGTWDANTKIASCLRGFKSEYRTRGVRGALDTLFLNVTNQDELANYIEAVEGIKNLQETGDTIYYASINNIYAEAAEEGKTLGFSSQAPPASIIYRTIPGAYTPMQNNDNPQTKPGTESYLPAINVKVIDKDAGGLEDVREFRFGAQWAVPVERPANIFYKTGI